MTDEKQSFDWNTWLWWVSLTALGASMALVIIRLLVGLYGAFLVDSVAGDQSSVVFQMALAPFFALGGVVIGAGQWIMLRGLIPQAGWWVLATAAGWLSGYLWSIILFSSGDSSSPVIVFLLPWLLIGVTTATCQWLVLRRWFERSALWIPAAVLTMLIGASGWLLGGNVGGVISWLAAGAFSGWILMRILPRKALWPERRARGEG